MLGRFFRNKTTTSLPVKHSTSLFFKSKSNRIVLFHTIHDCLATLRLSKELTLCTCHEDHFMAGTKCDGLHKRLSKRARQDHDLRELKTLLVTLKMPVAVLIFHLWLLVGITRCCGFAHNGHISPPQGDNDSCQIGIAMIKFQVTSSPHLGSRAIGQSCTMAIAQSLLLVPPLVGEFSKRQKCSTNTLGTIYLYT